MRLLYVGGFYSGYIGGLYASTPALALDPYAVQLENLRRDAFGWTGVWSEALSPLGYEVEELYPYVRPLEHAWLRENRAQRSDLPDGRELAVEQAHAFRPDVVFFDHSDRDLLLLLKENIPSIKMILGWEGSALVRLNQWRDVDLVLSCAPESVETLRSQGVASEHIHHGFSPSVLKHLRPMEQRFDLSFFGQILRGTDLHLRRERILEELVDSGIALSLFSPGGDPGMGGDLRAGMRIAAFAFHQVLRSIGAPDRLRRALPFSHLGDQGASMPSMPVSRKLGKRLLEGKYGLDMYQAIRDSRIVLNIHADSSPRYASNMRLFEITGAGACMLTDRKQNIGELFEPGHEVVVYEDAQDCAEKARWLLAHESERAGIAAAGQRRTLAEHTFLHRGRRLDALIRRTIG